jgi:D-aspartate ligase
MDSTFLQPVTTTRQYTTEGKVGAVVVGGDYQGLGIVRSLGRQGVPVCVVDDEYSISKFSKYASHALKVPNLRDERTAVSSLLDLGRRLELKGWILYPTRDELVAAFARYRSELSEIFRVPRQIGRSSNGRGISGTLI